MIYEQTNVAKIRKYAEEHIRRRFDEMRSFFGSQATTIADLRIQPERVPGGNPLTCAFIMKCDYSGATGTNGREGETELFVKYCADRPDWLPAGFLDVPPKYWQVEHETYRFCNFGYMPDYFSSAPKSRFIVQRRIQGETLDRVIAGISDEGYREEIAKSVLEALAKLHADLRVKMINLRDARLRGAPEGENFLRLTKHFFSGKNDNPAEKVLGYIRAIKGLESTEMLPEEVGRTIRRHYWVIGNSYAPQYLEDQVSHGNPTTSNIMIDGESRIIILDPNIKFRRHAVDAAEFISSPGMNLSPEACKRAYNHYWDLFDRQAGRESRHRVKFVDGALRVFGIANGMTTTSQVEESQRERDWFNYCVHEPVKTLGKGGDIKKYFPWLWDELLDCRAGMRNVHKEMPENVVGAFESIVGQKKAYGLGDRALEGYEELRKLFIDEKWIVPEDLSKKTARVVMPGNPAEGQKTTL